MLIYQSLICDPRMTQNLNQPKQGLIWVYFHLMAEQLHINIWNTKHFIWYRCIQNHTKQEALWWTSHTTSIPYIPNKCTTHSGCKWPPHGIEAINFFISFGCLTCVIIAYLLWFSTSLTLFFDWTMTDIKGKSNYSKLEFKFKKSSIGITAIKIWMLQGFKHWGSWFEISRLLSYH